MKTLKRTPSVHSWPFFYGWIVVAVGTLGVILSRPLGAALQAHVTTKADVGDLEIDSVVKSERAGAVVHFVRTEA